MTLYMDVTQYNWQGMVKKVIKEIQIILNNEQKKLGVTELDWFYGHQRQ